MGQLGNQLIISGQIEPTIELNKDEWKLLAFVNSANTRYFDLSLEGHQMQLVGTDGGFLNNPVEIEQLVLAQEKEVLFSYKELVMKESAISYSTTDTTSQIWADLAWVAQGE